MKKFGIWLTCALALLAIAACDDNEDDVTKVEEYDDSYYAAQATVTSSDANYTANDTGGTINFKTEGGTVTLSVSCGCDWIAENSASDLFSSSKTDTTLTITAEQNTIEEDQTGTITLKTENQRITFATIEITQAAYGVPTISVETSECNFPAVGTLTAEIAVEASAEWTAEVADAWLTASKTATGLSLIASENEETTGRSTKITLTCTDDIKTAYENITVTQDGKAYISISEESIEFDSAESSTSIKVESNYDWDYSYDTNAGWLTITRDGNALTVTASTNESTDDRETVVAFSAGDGEENVAEAQLTVVQAGESGKYMIFTYTITEANTTTQLPLYGDVDCTVNWGDGTVETITDVEPSHTYATTGEFDISIKGTVTKLYSKNISGSGSGSNPSPLTTITAVKQWGDTGLTDMSYAFYYCSNLASVPSLEGFSAITSFDECFYNCTSLTEAPTFANCTGCTDFYGAFYGCTALTYIPDDIFSNCSAAKNFGYVFRDTKITSIPEGLFDDCPNVTSFTYAFRSCPITTIPSGLFDKGTKVTNFCGVFYSCASLTEIPDGLFDNCTAATDFSFSFWNDSKLAIIPDGLFKNCSKVTTFQTAFLGCTALTSIPYDMFSGANKVTVFQNVFSGCTNIASESPYDLIDVDGEEVKVHLYERENYPSIYTAPTSYSSAFKNCTKMTDYKDIPSGWTE